MNLADGESKWPGTRWVEAIDYFPWRKPAGGGYTYRFSYKAMLYEATARLPMRTFPLMAGCVFAKPHCVTLTLGAGRLQSRYLSTWRIVWRGRTFLLGSFNLSTTTRPCQRKLERQIHSQRRNAALTRASAVKDYLISLSIKLASSATFL